MDKWKALAVSREEFKALTAGKKGWAGLDLGKTTDLTADAFVCWLDDGRLAVSAHGYMPEDRATQHEHSDRVPYKFWAKEGWCTLTEGAVTDYFYIKNLHE
jgi:phage terminase large subunit-like protein